jgi:predicted dienelactone hydrolase
MKKEIVMHRVLNQLFWTLLLGIAAINCTFGAGAKNNTSQTLPWMSPTAECEVLDLAWTDQARKNREVPVRVYVPKTTKTSCPLVLFSHGLGGSKDAAEYLGRYLAGHGYVSVHLQHHGSDTLIFAGVAGSGKNLREAAGNSVRLSAGVRDAATSSVRNVQNAIDRVKDVSFAIDTLTRLNGEPGPLQGRIDLDRIGIAGHSFGANTAMLSMGQQLPAFVTGGTRLREPRIKAALVLSAPAPKRFGDLKPVFASVKVPVMHMTGTKDDSPIGETTAEQRRTAYDNTEAAEQYLVTFDGGDHMIFSGRRVDESREQQDSRFHEWINAAGGAFFDAYLKDDASARKWLKSGDGLTAFLANHARVESK